MQASTQCAISVTSHRQFRRPVGKGEREGGEGQTKEAAAAAESSSSGTASPLAAAGNAFWFHRLFYHEK